MTQSDRHDRDPLPPRTDAATPPDADPTLSDDWGEETPDAPGVLFPLGRVVATPAALEFLVRHATSPATLLAMHQHGDWGDIDPVDARENVLSLKAGFRVMSVYKFGPAQEALWIITEADRSTTTLLLPGDY